MKAIALNWSYFYITAKLHVYQFTAGAYEVVTFIIFLMATGAGVVVFLVSCEIV